MFDVKFPPKGTLITPQWPAATNARSFVLLRCLGLLAGVVAQAVDGRMPADQETIRYTGFFGSDSDGRPFLSREVLGGGSGGRHYADGNDAIHIVPDSRNQPAEFTETRFPLLVETLALRTDSGGAGQRRGGLGYEKHYRALVDCRTIVTADRVRLGCYGVNSGKAGQPFCVTVDAEGEARDLGGLVDGEQVLAGQVVRVVTTGGGGWGDPLEREPELVERDVVDGKVSLAAARSDYGVVLVDTTPPGRLSGRCAGHRQAARRVAPTRAAVARLAHDRPRRGLRADAAWRMRAPHAQEVPLGTRANGDRSRKGRAQDACRTPPAWSSALPQASSPPTR